MLRATRKFVSSTCDFPADTDSRDISNSVARMAEPERTVGQPRLRVANAKERTGMGLELIAEELRVIGGLSL